MWSSAGNAWQILIKGNRFYKCVGDVVLPGTTNTVPQDVVIEDNIFSGPAASCDCNLYLQGAGSGINGVIINNNVFTAMPAIGSGTNVRYIHATGCVGILSNNVFLAYQVNGEPLPRRHGFPLRTVAEGYYGYDWVKYVYKITVERIQSPRQS